MHVQYFKQANQWWVLLVDDKLNTLRTRNVSRRTDAEMIAEMWADELGCDLCEPEDFV